ncbi:MAG: hypothetical protein WA126_04410 [Thermodesulfovibrionales bacterium]
MKIRLCVLCLIAVFAFSGCAGSVPTKISFAQSDLEASWSMVGHGRERGIKFNSLGSLTLSPSGEVAGGTAHEFGVDMKSFTGGKLFISDQGSLSGFIDTYLADSDTRTKYAILDGQMNLEKDIVVFEGKFPTDRRGIVILIAKNRTSAQADLAGTWVVLHDRAYSLSINKEGTITECTLATEGGTGKGICEGEFSLDPSGTVSARLLFSEAREAAITISGQLNSGKNFMALAGSDSMHFEGTTLIFVRRNGTFSVADMEGSWRFAMTGHNGTFFGTLRMDKTGNVIEGAWCWIGVVANDSGAISGGKLFLTEKGEISGSFKISSGETYEILGGQMSPKKDIVGALYLDLTRSQGVMLFTRIP